MEPARMPKQRIASYGCNLAAFLLSERHTEGVAYVTPTRSIGRTELRREVRRAASGLEIQGVGVGDRAILMLNDDIELVVLFLACLAVGCVPAVASPKIDRKSLTDLFDDADAEIVFTEVAMEGDATVAGGMAAKMPSIVPVEPYLGGALGTSWLSFDADPCWNNFVWTSEEALAFLQYTSGSSGRPKGVMHCFRSSMASCRLVANELLSLGSKDLIYATPKMFFGFGMGASILFTLYSGCTAILDPRWATTETIRENVQALKPTIFLGVPTVYRRLLADGFDGLGSIRIAIASGASLPPALRNAWRRMHGLDLREGYGSTELCHLSAVAVSGAMDQDQTIEILDGISYALVDEDGSPVPTGTIGELRVASPALAIGYLNKPDETARRFIDGWFATGDLFHSDERGQLTFHGRSDDNFKVFGRWVSPIEIERLVKGNFCTVEEAVVVPATEASGETRAVLITSGGVEAGAEEEFRTLLSASLQSLLHRHQRPALHLHVDQMPLNMNGKLSRPLLAQMADQAIRVPAQGVS